MAAASTPSLAFPHSSLTKIVGKPSFTSIQLLTKELYTNARAIPSLRGGGAHGHLGLIMPPAAYLTLAGHDFTVPAHPGPAPVHANNASGPVITENNRAYAALTAELAVIAAVRVKLKQMLLTAVDRIFLQALDDELMGFADVDLNLFIPHLTRQYGTITRAELELNRASITTAWNLDEPIEELWTRLRTIKRVSVAGNDPLSNTAIMELSLVMFEQTGVFTTACDTWRVKATATKTMLNFQLHFTAENLERCRKLTAAQGGFHGANAVVPVTPPRNLPPASTDSAAAATTLPPVLANDGTRMYYCWTHGLGTNASHTSATCQRKADGHKDDATVLNMQGGNNTIMRGGRRPPRD